MPRAASFRPRAPILSSLRRQALALVTSVVAALLGSLATSTALAEEVASASTASPGVNVVNGEVGDLSRDEADAFVKQILALVDKDGFIPAERGAFDETREALRRFVAETDGKRVSRSELYRMTRRHLNTLDADGHTLLWSRDQMAGWQRKTQPDDVAQGAAVVERLTTASGVVLVYRPPAATFTDPAQATAYARETAAKISEADVAPRPCALVVSLDDQTGGNAWPVIEAMQDVFTQGNRSRFVNAKGNRWRIVTPWPFAHDEIFRRFAETPIGVVFSGRTASAGEMLAVMLVGEKGVRTFGQPTYGMTTANTTHGVADGATLLLSMARYAQGDAAPYRGPIAPDEAVAESAHQDLAVRAAAEWAASQASACRVAPQ